MTFASSLPPTSLSGLGQPVRSAGGRRVGSDWQRGGKKKNPQTKQYALLPWILGAQRARRLWPIRERGPRGAECGGLHFPEASRAPRCLSLLRPLDHSVLGLLGRLRARGAGPERDVDSAKPLVGRGEAALARRHASGGARAGPKGCLVVLSCC